MLTGLHGSSADVETELLQRLQKEFNGIRVVLLAGLSEDERKSRLDKDDYLELDAVLEAAYKEKGQIGPQHIVGPSEETVREVFPADVRKIDAQQEKEDVVTEVIDFIEGRRPTDLFYVELTKFEDGWKAAKAVIEETGVFGELLTVPVASEAKVLHSPQSDEGDSKETNGPVSEASHHDSKAYTASMAFSLINPLSLGKAIPLTADEVSGAGHFNSTINNMFYFQDCREGRYRKSPRNCDTR